MKKNDDFIAIYSRKSKFTGKGESVENQIEFCKEYIRCNYGDKSIEKIIIYEDEGFSGGDLNRPGFKEMMKAAHRRKFKAILVYRLDRISRNIGDFSGLIEELSKLEIDFISIKEQFDTSTPLGRAMMYIASIFSQLERETIAERIRDNMHELAKTGRWLGGVTPTGYSSESVKNITIEGKTKKSCKLKIIPKEAETVKMIYNLFSKNHSLTATESELMQKGIVTKNGKYYTRFSIKAILQNPVYLISDQDAFEYFENMGVELFSDIKLFDGKHGIMAYNRTFQQKGRTTIYLPMNEWIVAVGQHKGIIPSKVWIEVQNTLEENKSKSYRRPRKNEALLTGILYCKCGSRMYAKQNKNPLSYTYICKLKERSKRDICNIKNIDGNLLDKIVINEIKQLNANSIDFLRRINRIREFYNWDCEFYEEKLLELKQNKDDIEGKISSLVDTLATMNNEITKLSVVNRIEQLNNELVKIQDNINDLKEKTKKQVINKEKFEKVKNTLFDMKEVIDIMDIEEKRNMVKSIISKVIWDGENVHIIMFGNNEKIEI